MIAIKDEISALNAQIKLHRESTGRIRLTIRQLRERRMGQRDPMALFRANCALSERLAMIRACQSRIGELRPQIASQAAA